MFEKRFAAIRTPALALMMAGMFSVMGSIPAHTQGNEENTGTDDKILLELNRLVQQEDACRVYMLVENKTDFDLQYTIDLVIFNDIDQIDNRLRVRMDELLPGKTMVRIFDIGNYECGSIGRVLLNNVPLCKTTPDINLGCLEKTKINSRARVELTK